MKVQLTYRYMSDSAIAVDPITGVSETEGDSQQLLLGEEYPEWTSQLGEKVDRGIQ